MVHLSEWKMTKKLKHLPMLCWNDCISNDGDMSFFGVNCEYKNNWYHKEILDAVSRQVVSNSTKWKSLIGLLFLKKHHVDSIKQSKLLKDEIQILSTKHYNVKSISDCENRKIKKLFFKNRFESINYDADDIAAALDSINEEQWPTLLSVAKNPSQTAKNILNFYYKDRVDSSPSFLRKFIDSSKKKN